MCDVLVWFLQAITGINWLELIKAIAPVVTAFIAFRALRNWQRQDKAKREAEFLDALIEATHTYIAEMHKPISLLEMAKIGMASHVPPGEDGEHADRDVKGAIAYIQEHGQHIAVLLSAALAATRPSAVKLTSLAVKGQVFRFDGYTKCHNSVRLLRWYFDRIAGFTAVIQSSTKNWGNPEVLEFLKAAMKINPDDIRQSVKDENVAILEFIRKTYQKIYI